MEWLFIMATVAGFVIWGWAKIVFRNINDVMEDTHE